MYREMLPRLPKGLEARLGIEIGAGNHNPEKAREMSSFPDLDLVLGSIHNLRDTEDFYYIKYESETHCRELMDLYADELIDLAGMDFYDIIAHIGYTRRYMLRDGFDIHFDLEHYGDKIRELFGILIQNGRGIEINCSGVRSESVLSPTPSMEILKLYRQMGGELITVGSDSHNVRSAGVNIPWGYEQLRQAGFKYVAVYRKRSPEMIKIED
jgi:histidinol-phosphatase (PHP family)